MVNVDLSQLDKQSTVILYNELLHAANAHLTWLHRFNKCLLIGTVSLDSFLNEQGHEFCEFGRWLKSNPTLPDVIPSLGSIIDEHKAMHDCSYKIACQKKQGDPILAADYSAFASHQTALMQLIMGLLESLKSSVFLFDTLTNTFNRK